MSRRTIIFTLIAFLLSMGVLFTGFNKSSTNPQEVYRVYMEGKSIGLIHSKEELENYIDNEQRHLKEKYQVNKVYAPKDLDIIKEYTFDEAVSSTDEIYSKIKDIKPFTLNGYTITIKGVEEVKEDGTTYTTPNVTIYVLDRKIFETAVDRTVRAFINGTEYDLYLQNKQAEIKDSGKIIDNIYLKNDITIKKENIPADQMIYTSVEDLSKFLMFGTLDDQQKYIVKEGDTISDVAFDNKISPEEFLIANPQFTDVNNLLFPGQEVTLGILQPQFKTVEEEHSVQLQEVKYQPEIRYDNTKLIGTQEVIQKGQSGLNRITQKIVRENGEIKSAEISAVEELKPVVNEIIVKGGRSNSYLGEVGVWLWPTKIPYIVSSGFGYRWGTLHDAIDITGPGYGSPIYSANYGTVETASYTSINGNYIVINHHNGFYTLYAHLADMYVQKGQQVNMGDIIGSMGQTGLAYGTHLHFAIWKGFPYGRGSTPHNPLLFY